VTLQQVLAAARERLVAAGIAPDEAAIDVDVYAREILGWDRARLLTDQLSPPPAELEPRFSEWVERRTRHEPVSQIVGVREFWGLDFTVTPAVLIPRPETEFIVEEALLVMQGQPAPRIADIGTGSGCLAVTLACEIADSRVTASDLSADALAVASVNARDLGVAARVRFVHTSYLDGIDGPFDLIVANPPYVAARDPPLAELRYEPVAALVSGADGLDAIREIVAAAPRHLLPGGWLLLEHGIGQDGAVRDLLERAGLENARTWPDLAGIPRVSGAKR